jgi:sugar/nucleoside kinase (ribokinase family)
MRKTTASRFRRILGIGGIGVGWVYALEGDRTLGREESRPARLLDIVDRCKLQIILHYVAVAVRDLRIPIEVVPVGMVGKDAEGRLLLGEMNAAGMRTNHVRAVAGHRTQTSICFQYPDGSGGNITESASAAAQLTARSINGIAKSLSAKDLVLVAPEVPMAVRLSLIATAHRRKALVAASFTSHELTTKGIDQTLKRVDLLAVNMHEARTWIGASAQIAPERVAATARARFIALNPRGKLSITDGGRGSYYLTAQHSHFQPGMRVAVANTAGAGDAYFAGMLLAEAFAGPKGADPQRACALARAIAALSVTSRDTIHQGFSLAALRAFARTNNLHLSLEST